MYHVPGLPCRLCPREPRVSFIYVLEVAEEWILSM